jgi:hypothetical protein
MNLNPQVPLRSYLNSAQKSLLDDVKTMKRIELSLKKSKELDQTANMDRAAREFRFENAKDEMWNPEIYSLLYGTPVWDQADSAQKVKLNQLFWVAYYSQIISAEIATIFFNQTSCAALYGVEDFRAVCDTLDLESAQERAHIAAFKKISEDVESSVFGERVFSYPMRTPFVKTMLYSDLGEMRQYLRKWQLRTYSLLSSNSAFIGCQYFTVRGLRTLNGKIVQHRLSQFYSRMLDQSQAPIPSKISFYHFIDESFHFNTSTVISHDVVNSLKAPNRWESLVANLAIQGCQKDHFNFSTAINGIFWYDPALYATIYRVLRSKVFNFDHQQALDMIENSFCFENEGMLASQKTHRESVESYKSYLADFKYVNQDNKCMNLMSRNSLGRHLETNRREFKSFAASFK